MGLMQRARAHPLQPPLGGGGAGGGLGSFPVAAVLWSLLAWLALLLTFFALAGPLSDSPPPLLAASASGAAAGGGGGEAGVVHAAERSAGRLLAEVGGARGLVRSRDEDSYIYPGREWLDVDGKPIQAHGGGILRDPASGLYFWYGEVLDGVSYKPDAQSLYRVDAVGICVYSSPDLVNWKNLGLALAADKDDPHSDLYYKGVMERPKVIYHKAHKKYVMRATVGLAVSDRPEGPFTYMGSQRPHKQQSRDFTIFQDNDKDATAYIVYSSEENKVMHVGRLTADYLGFEDKFTRIYEGESREAPAVFKYKNLYFMYTSWCTGWLPNEALVSVADTDSATDYFGITEDMMGKWHHLGDPCRGKAKNAPKKTFNSQGAFIIPIESKQPGQYIFAGDRFVETELIESTFVWLPLIVEEDRPGAVLRSGRARSGGFLRRGGKSWEAGATWPNVTITWRDKWRLPVQKVVSTA
eukprot:SM000187S03880  [mRNA]  locus=s187:111209:113642:+ [translate_table: standard]